MSNTPPATRPPQSDTPTGDETVRVRAPISDVPPGASLQYEAMHALSDPAAEDQAVLNNAPGFCDYLNFGDIVRVGPARDNVRPILEVVAASGHRRVMTFTDHHDPSGLVEHLRGRLPEHALRLEGMRNDPPGPHFLTVSVHPDFDPEDVRDEIADWLDDQGASPATASISPPIETQLGSVEWPAE